MRNAKVNIKMVENYAKELSSNYIDPKLKA